MLTLKRFVFSGDQFYQDATDVPLGQAGLAFFMGQNLDGTGALSNGAAKTRLIQILQGFIFGNTERHGHFKRTVLPDFRGTLQFANDAGDWEFAYDLARDRWEIEYGGSPLVGAPQHPSECLALLKKQIGFTRQEWCNHIHIDGRSISTLLKGKPAERKACLEALFSLDEFYAQKRQEYENLRDALDRDIQTLRQRQAQHHQIVSLLSTKESVSYLTLALQYTEQAEAVLARDLETLTSEMAQYDRDVAIWVEYQTLFDDVRSLPRLEVLRERQAELNATLADLNGQQTRQQQLRRYVQTDLEPARKALVESPAQPEAEKPNAADVEKLGRDITAMRQKAKVRDQIRAIQLPDVSDITQTSEALAASQQTILDSLTEARFHLGLVREGDACPRCGQKLDFILQQASPQDARKALERQIAELTRQQVALTEQQDRLQQHAARSSQIAALQKVFDDYPKFGKTLPNAEREYADLQAAAAAWRRHEIALASAQQAQITYDQKLAHATALGYPDLLQQTIEIDAPRRDLEALQRDIVRMERFQTLCEKVISMPPKSEIQTLQDACSQQRAALQEYYRNILELKGSYRNDLQTVQSLQRQQHDLEHELARQRDLDDQYRVMEGLAKFYGSNGYKIFELRGRCERLIENANRWSDMFFQEPYEWSMPADIEALDFLVQPKRHRATKPYPVGQMSSGEENRAAGVLLFAQIEIAPPNKRANVLFLDEVERNLDASGREAFVEIVVPKIRECFADRSVVVISHLPSLQESIAIDRVWVARRQNRKTTFRVESRKAV